MRNNAKVFIASFLLAGTVIPAYAGGLLGGIIGSENSLITINPGSASDTGLVNLGLGGGNGNIVDVGVGGGEPLVGATVGTGNGGLGADVNVGTNLVNATVGVGGTGGGLLDTDVNLLGGAVDVSADIGGPGGLIDVGIGVGTGTGTPGTPGNPGNPGNPGTPGGPGAPLNPGGPLIPGGLFANGGSSGMPACDNGSANDVARLIRGTQANASWARASGVKVQRIDICPEVKVWLATQLQGSALGNALRAAVQSDPLLNASLSRTSYGADRVFAINEKGGQLVVYVY